MQKKEPPDNPPLPLAVLIWIETSESVSRRYQFELDGLLSVKIVDDFRPAAHKAVESFLSKFFPSGYPYSVNEGYLRYTQFRALQHFSSVTLSVLSTQSLLFAAGLRPTLAQATAVSWILKDGREHVGKLICSNLGARMDSEPKCWRILGDVFYDLGTGLEVLSPLCPQLFLEMAGLGNFAKWLLQGRQDCPYILHLPKNEILVIFLQKLLVGPLLSIVHVYGVCEEMRKLLQ